MAVRGIWSSVEEFTRAVDAINELERDDAIRLLVGASSTPYFFDITRSVRFELPSDSPKADSVIEAKGFTRESFERVARDVADVLSALGQDIPEDRVFATRSRYGPNEEDRESLAQKFQYARERFNVRDLRERHWVKATSTHPLQQGFLWNINVRAHNAVLLPPTRRPIPYAVLSLRTAPVEREPYIWPSVPPQINMTVDREDVLALRDELNRLLAQLLQIEKNPDD